MGFLDFLFGKKDEEEEKKKKLLPIQPLKRLVDFLPNRQLTPVEPPAPLSSYKVQPGDNLWEITERVNGDPSKWPKLYEENRQTIGNNPNLILPKQNLDLTPIQPKLSLGPRISSLSELKENPSPPFIKMRSAHEVPIEPVQTSSTWDKIKVGDIKGLTQEVGLGLSHGLSKTGTAKQDKEIAKILADNPIMSKFGNDQLEKIQAQKDYLEANPVNSLPAIIGEQVPMIPLWMTGEAAVSAIGKGITKLAPPLRPLAEKASSKLPSFVKGGLKDAGAYTTTVAPVESFREGESLGEFLDRERMTPGVLLGGMAFRGVGAGAKLGKDVVGEGGSLRQALELRKLNTPEINANPFDDVRNAYQAPSLRDAHSRALNETFTDAPNPLQLKTLQRGIDDSVGVRSPTSTQALTQRELDAQSAFGGPLDNFKLKQRITPQQRSYEARQAELSDTFKDLPIGSVDTPIAQRTLQEGIDSSLGIGKPRGEYEGLDAFGKPVKSYKRDTSVDEITAKMNKQVDDIEAMIKQADEQTPIGSIRKTIKDMGGIRQADDGIFEERRIIPSWIKNDATGRPLDEVADTLGMTSDDLLVAISDSAYKPRNYRAEAQAIANQDAEYSALENTLQTLKGELPGKRTLDTMPKLKPRESTPRIESPLEQPQRLGLSGTLPPNAPIQPPIRPNVPLRSREAKPIQPLRPTQTQRILPEREPLIWNNRENISNAGQPPLRSITQENLGALPKQRESSFDLGQFQRRGPIRPPKPVEQGPIKLMDAKNSKAPQQPDFSIGSIIETDDLLNGKMTLKVIGGPESKYGDSLLFRNMESGQNFRISRDAVLKNIADTNNVNPSVAARIERPTPETLTIEPIRPRINQVNQLTQNPPTKIVGAEPEIPTGLKERGASRNARTDTNNPDALRDSYSDNPLTYEQIHGADTLSKAQAIFDQGYESAVAQVGDLAAKLQPEAAPLAKMLARKATEDGNIQGAREILSDIAERMTQAGQFSQAARLLRESDPETFLMTIGKQLKKLNKEGSETYGKKWRDFDLTPDELNMIGKIERGNQQAYENAFEQIQSRIANEMPATAMEKINAWRHMSMLLNPKTHVRNVAGNGIMMGMRKAAQRVSGGLQKVLLKESERTQSGFVSKDYKDLASQYFEANKKDLLSGANKYQDNVSVSMPNKRVFKNNTLEKTRRFNYDLLQWGDNPFFRNAYVDRLASYAQAKGVKDFSKLTREAFDIARMEAEQATYKDAGIIADFINRAKRPSNDANIARKGGAILVEAALPFTKTPINIVKRGLQFSPIGVANGLAGIRSSKGAATAIDEMAKGLTGTGVLGLGYLLASKGILTGKAEKDADLKAYNSNTGNSPFSVLGKYSYDFAQPFSIPLSVGVEIHNAIKDNPKDVAKMNSVIENNNIGKLQQMATGAANAIIEGMTASGDTVFNMSLMRGVKQLIGGQTGFMEGMAQLPQSYATQFIPTVSNQLAGTVDPIVRQTYVKGDMPASLKNAIVSRIPLASKTLEPRQTPFGDDVKRIENPAGRAFSQFLSPGIIANNQNIDPKIDAALRRLNEFGLTKQFPTMVPNYIEKTQSHPRIELTPKETTQYQKRVGELTLNAFEREIGKGSYINARDNKKKNKSADEIRADLLAEAIADAKAKAKKEILRSKGLK